MVNEQKHFTEFSDLPRKKEAVYNEKGCIKGSFLRKYAMKSLEGQILRIEGRTSRKILNPEERAQIESLGRKANLLKPEAGVPDTGMSNGQFFEIGGHVLSCSDCTKKVASLRGDLPPDGLKFEG